MGFIFSVILGIALNGAGLYALVKIIPEITYSGGFLFFLLGGVLLWLINLFVKPLLKIMALPFVILTGGLFLIVINAFILWFLSYFFSVLQFNNVALTFPNFGSYVIGAIVFGLINWAVQLISK